MPTLPPNKAKPATPSFLSERLFAIANCLPRGGIVCDVGSDHGLLPLYLLKEGLCSGVLVTDLNPKPLERAKRAFGECGLTKNVFFLQADGIPEPKESLCPNAYVIAGMGGETISGILSRALKTISPETFFVFQPMTRSSYLRRFLYENGFRVQAERVVCENGKFFLIFSAVFDGICRVNPEAFYFLGEFLPKSADRNTRFYLEKKLQQIRNKKQGKEKAKICASEEEKQMEQILSVLEKNYENS